MAPAEPAPVAAPGPQKRLGSQCWLRLAGGLLALSLVALLGTALDPRLSPRIVPVSVLVDGRSELVATLEAEYQAPNSWHGVDIGGGACQVSAPCAEGRCPVLGAAVRRPRFLAGGRMSFEASLARVWSKNMRRAFAAGSAELGVECALKVSVDVFGTGWRVERELRWSSGGLERSTELEVVRRSLVPRLENGTATLTGSYALLLRSPPGSRVVELLRSVPVTLRAHVGFAERHGALEGRFAVDSALAVTTGASGGLSAEVPYNLTTSAAWPQLMKYLATASDEAVGGEGRGELESRLEFVAAPGAPVSAALFGDAHSLSWGRSFSTSAESERRLDRGRRLGSALQDMRMSHRIRLDDEEVGEFVVEMRGGPPAQLRVQLRVADLSGASLGGAKYVDMVSVSLSADKPLEPEVDLHEDVESDLLDVAKPFGNFSLSMEGEGDFRFLAEDLFGQLELGVNRTGEDFSLNLAFGSAEATVVGELALSDGVLNGSLTASGEPVASLNGTLTKADAAGKQHLAATVTAVGVSISAEADLMKLAGGGQVSGSLEFSNGTAIGGLDMKFERADSGDMSAAFALSQAESEQPRLKFASSFKKASHQGGRFTASAEQDGKRMLSTELKLEKTVGGDVAAYAIMEGAEGPPAARFKADLDSDAGFGGKWTALLEAQGEPVVDFLLATGEDSEWRTVEISLDGRDFVGAESFAGRVYSSSSCEAGGSYVYTTEKHAVDSQLVSFYQGGLRSLKLHSCSDADHSAQVALCDSRGEECQEPVALKQSLSACAPLNAAGSLFIVATELVCLKSPNTQGASVKLSKADAETASAEVTLLSDGAPQAQIYATSPQLSSVFGTQMVDGRREIVLLKFGRLELESRSPTPEKSWRSMGSVVASIAQVESVVTLGVTSPAGNLTGKFDSSDAAFLSVDVVLEAPANEGAMGGEMVQYPDAEASISSAATMSSAAMMSSEAEASGGGSLTLRGKLEHAQDKSSGRLTLASGGTTMQEVDLTVSRGFIPKDEGKYALTVSASAVMEGSAKVQLREAYLETDAEQSLTGVGGGIVLTNATSGKEQYAGDLGARFIPAAANGSAAASADDTAMVDRGAGLASTGAALAIALSGARALG